MAPPLVTRGARVPRPTSPAAVAFLAALLIFGMGSWQIWRAREVALLDAQGDARNMTRALAQHATRSFEAVDLVLTGLVDRVEHGALAEPQRFKSFLETRAKALGQVRNIAVLDDKGDWVSDSLRDAHPPMNTGDRSYFAFHRDISDAGMLLGDPLFARVSGIGVIPVTRRWNKPDGSFGGVVIAAVDPEYFQRFYASLGVGKEGAIALISRSARILARHPGNVDAVGLDVSSGPLFRTMLPRASSDVVRSQSALDGRDLLAAYESLDDFPLIVWVSAGVDETLANWWRAALVEGSALALSVIALGGLGVGLSRHRRRALAAERARSESEAHLRTKSALLETTLASMDQGLIVVSRDGRIEVCNRRALELLDLPASLVADKPTPQAVLAYQRARGEFEGTDPETRRFLDDGATADEPHTYTRVRPNGTVLEIRSMPMEGGGLVRTYSDITAHRSAEAAMQASETRYRHLAETTTDVITRLDLSFKREYVSPACTAMFGFTPEEMLGAQPSATMHPDDAPAVRERARQLIAGEIAGERVTSTYRTRHKDGHWVWVEAGMNLLRDEATGEPRSLVCSLRDVTRRKQAETMLEESEARYRLLSDHATDMIVQADLDTTRRYVSPACRELFGYEPHELIGTRTTEFIHPDDRDAFSDEIASLGRADAETVVVQYRNRRKDGGYVWCEGNFRLLRDGEGRPSGYVATVRDIGERRRQAEAIEQARVAAETARAQAEAARAAADLASQAKTDFLAAMSHEIRTPLNGIIGYTDLLLGDPALAFAHRRQAERIQSAGGALLTVVNDILDFSKIEAGQVELDPQPFNLDALVDNAVSIVKGVEQAQRLTLEAEIGADVPRHLVGDQDRLRQVLLNLLNNAVKFTPAGRVTLSIASLGAGSGGSRLRFAVTDTGIGIPAERMARLFQRFSQVDGSIQRTFGGTGLGLAICKSLVELMGGEIGVESVLSRGSTFWFTVRLGHAAAGEAAEAAAASPEADVAGIRILLVEDLEINQELARTVLELDGHTVDVASDGAEAIMAVQAASYDLVLMDVQMPVMDGMTATRHIRVLDHAASQLPIIAMTANVLASQIAQFHAAGMDGHVGKPFKRDDLRAVVRRWAGQAAVPDAREVEAVTADGDPLDRATFEEMREMLGAAKMSELLSKLALGLSDGFHEATLTSGDPRHLASEAHKMVSSAGMLGFATLSQLCAELESACKGGGDVDALLPRVRQARREALREIEGLRNAA